MLSKKEHVLATKAFYCVEYKETSAWKPIYKLQYKNHALRHLNIDL